MPGASGKEILCCIGVHVDAEASRRNRSRSEAPPFEMTSRRLAAEIAVPRLLDLFYSFNMRTTWFIPSRAIQSFPRPMTMVVHAGHEIAVHRHASANPERTTAEQEEANLQASIRVVTEFSGAPPRGHTESAGAISDDLVRMLLANGIVYDTSRTDNDFHPFHARTGDARGKIDDTPEGAESSVDRIASGEETDLVEIGINRNLEDSPQSMTSEKSTSQRFVNPRDLEQIWRDQFDWIYRHYDYAVFPITLRPAASGRPHMLLMLERFIAHVDSHPGAGWVTFAEIADDFVNRYPRLGNARPESVREIWEHGPVG